MPRIICRTCGREVYATAPIEQLFADERRCPRCGAPLQNDRRATDRRQANRREIQPMHRVRPKSTEERRVKDRREDRRRGADSGPNKRSSGWLE